MTHFVAEIRTSKDIYRPETIVLSLEEIMIISIVFETWNKKTTADITFYYLLFTMHLQYIVSVPFDEPQCYVISEITNLLHPLSITTVLFNTSC